MTLDGNLGKIVYQVHNSRLSKGNMMQPNKIFTIRPFRQRKHHNAIATYGYDAATYAHRET
ncbi:hypothetical protein R6Q59_001709 [Mikania micrantha]